MTENFNTSITLDSTSIFIDEFKFLRLRGETLGLAPGQEISIAVTHVVTGESVYLTATLDAEGRFNLPHSDLSSLLDGHLLIEASVEVGGQTIFTPAVEYVMDADVGSLSVEWIFHSETGLVDIVGMAADVLAGTDVALVVTDSKGQTFEVTATVNPDGSFSVIDLDFSFLEPGEVTINAQATDNNGGPLSQDTMAELIDTQIVVELSLYVLPGDMQGITIIGSLSGLPAGTTVFISVWDQEGNQLNMTAQTKQDGSYSLSNIDANVFTNPRLKISAVAGEGNASGNASAEYALTIPADSEVSIVDATVGNDLLLSGVGHSSGFDEGTEVTVHISGALGGYTSTTVTVRADGSFVFSGISLAEMPEGMLQITATATSGQNSVSTLESFTVELIINQAPEGQDQTVTGTEDVIYTIRAADFNFTDADNHSFKSVKITSLPTMGLLKLNGVNVLLNAEISKADLDAGLLTFQGAQDGSGVNYTSLMFVVQDSGATHNEDLTPNTLTFSLAAVNDAPTVVHAIPQQVAAYNTAFSYTLPADIFADVDNDPLTYTATLADGSLLPGWLSFNANTRTFTGTPGSTTDVLVKVVASDGSLSVGSSFQISMQPVVKSLSITGATGIQASTLNADDTVTVTVVFSENVNVTGAPQLALNIGGTTVQANYVNGSGGSSLIFEYKILPGQNDGSGISIDANALTLNGGTITDTTGNVAILLSSAVSDNASYLVDTAAPAAPTMAGTDDVGVITGTIAANAQTDDTKPTFSGNAEAGSVVKIYDGSTLLGTTTANGSGAWSFTATNSLVEGEHSIKATATDAAGNTSPSTSALTFTVDTIAPVAMGDANTGTEDATVLTGNVATNDTSKDGSETYVIVGSATGVKGSLVLNANGSYTYTRTSSADEITSNLVEIFAYEVTDAAGNRTQSTLQITLTPVNDAAIISGTSTGAVTEAGSDANANATPGTPTVMGTLTSTDVDGTPNAFTAVTAGTASTGGYGTYAMTSAGVWTYTLNNNNATVQGLTASQTLTDSFTVTAADGTAKTVTVTINGSNDAALISDPVTGAVTEAGGVNNGTAGNPSATGTLTSTDVDGTANAFTAVSTTTTSTGGYGTYTMTSAGVWAYTLDNANTTVQALAAAATLTDTFTVTAADGTAKTVTITITGSNDAAVITGATTGAINEGVASTTGTVTSTDVDGSIANAFTAVAAGTASTSGYGTYALTSAGVWTYTLNNANTTVNALAAGATLTDTFTVAAADGTSKVVTVTITGTNDAAVISGPVTGAVTEAGGVNNGTAGNPSATGTLTSTDVDGTVNAFTAVSTATTSTGGYGTYTMTSAGVWAYALDNSNTTVQALAAAATLTDTFTVTAADGTAKTVTITITGSNDAAIISGTSTGAVTEAGGVNNGTAGVVSATGTLTSIDVDGTANAFTAVSTATTSTGGYGTYTMTSAGVWAYTLNNANTTVNALAAGATLTDTFSVIAADGTAKVVTITITGSNDAAVITGATTGAINEGVASTTGTVTSTDVDGTANAFTAVAPDTASTSGYGTYALTSAGVWTYTLNNANTTVNALAAGATLTDTFTVAAADGTSQVVTVTITGTNDAAVISGPVTGAVTEAGGVNNGTAGNPSATGTLTSTDVDGTANAFTAVSTATTSTGGYGTYTMTSAGVWAYTLDNANTTVQALAAAATLTDTFTVTAADGTAKTVTITITGSNDAAVISGTSSASLNESNAIQSASGTLTSTDVDGTANLFTAQTGVAGNNNYGTFSITTAGAWTYAMNTAHNEFVAGQVYTDSIIVTSADGTTQGILVQIYGTNDAAVISGTSTGAVTEAGGVNNGTAGVVSATGTLTSIDVDGTANAFTAVSTATTSTGGYGTYTMTSAGVWAYTLDNANATVQARAAAATLTDTFTVTAADGTAKTVTITITGSNDAAIISGTSTGAVTEAGGVNNGTAGNPGATGTLTSTDVDGTANAFTAVSTATTSTGGYGTYTMTSAGVWAYTLDNANTTVQALAAAATLTDTFTVTAADGTAKTVTITITGSNDAAVISGTSSGAVTEAGGVSNAIAGNPNATGTLTSTDVDGTANAFTAVSTATTSTGGYGTYTMTAAGVWAYTLNNSNTTVQALAASATLTDTFTVTAADGTAKVVTITITGSNDAAVISGTSTASLNESNAIQSASGTLTSTDVDGTANLFTAQTGVAGNNNYGTFSITTAGAWTYAMNTAHDEFVAGTNYTDKITVAAADGTTQVITVTITGSNDAPVIVTPANPITTLEDTAITFVISTQLAGNVTDAEGTALKGIVIVQNTSTSGTWAYSTDGTTWVDFPTTYLGTVDWTKVMYLNASDSLRYTPAANANGANLSDLNFRAVDATFPNTVSGTQVSVISTIGGTGAVSNQAGHFTVSVTAVNDAPVFASDVVRATLEDVTFEEQVSSLLAGKVTDVDSAGIAGVGITWDFGTGHSSTGTWYWADSSKLSWTAISKPAYGPSTSIFLKVTDYLRFVPSTNADTSAQQGNMVVRVADDSMPATASGSTVNLAGALPNYWSSGEHSIIVNITPVNDAPVINTTSVVTMTAIDEDTAEPVNGNTTAGMAVSAIFAAISDVDSVPTPVKGIAITSVNGNGTLYYSADNGVTWQAASGLSITNALLLDANGRVYFKPNANWNGTIDNAFLYLGWDQTNAATVGSKVAISGTGGNTAYSLAVGKVGITVNAVNDAPIAVADTASIGEAGGVTNLTAGTALTSTTSGVSTLNVLANDTDIDNATSTLVVKNILKGTSGTATAVAAGTTSVNGQSIAGLYGSLVIGSDGSYTYTVDQANSTVQALNTGGSVIDVFTYTVNDPSGLTSTTTLKVTVNGTNDAPIVAVAIPDQTAVIGTAFSYTVPTGSFTDVDSTITYTATRGDGTALPSWLTFDSATRTFSGTPTDTVDFNIKVTASDGTASISDTFALGIAPVANSVAITGTTGIQNNFLNAGDTISATVNFTELVTVTGTPQITLNIGGTLVKANYVSGSGTSALTFSYTILAGQTDTNGIGINANSLGLNGGTITDAQGNNATQNFAAITDNISYKVDTTAATALADIKDSDEDTTPITGSVATNDTNKDGSESYAIVGSAAGTYGTLTMNANGTYSYARSVVLDSIQTTAVETFTYKVTDAAGNTTQSTLTINMAPVNDAAVIAGDLLKTVNETNAAMTVTGALTITDVDSAQTFNVLTGVVGTYGSFSMTTAGAWTYVMSAAQDQFKAGVAYNDVFTVSSADGTSKIVTITINGTNDAPVVAAAIPDQTAVLGAAFSYTLPAGTFSDSDSTLTYTATRGDGTALPTWMTFDAATLTFSGTPTDTIDFNIKVTASDGTASISDAFLVGIAPVASSASITSSTGIQNNFLNEGDTVTATVNFGEKVYITGTPQITLNIGGTLVKANYVSGSGTSAIAFSYTILAGQTDANGISINANSLGLNGGTLKDASGNNATQNFAVVADNISYKVDTTAPVVGTLTLTDTGSSPTDGITKNGVVTVAGLESGATWEYSTNNGTTWAAGTGTSFTLAAGTYAAGSVQMRETDTAGNVQTGALIAKNAAAITVDTTAPAALTVALAIDTGASLTDKLTQTGALNITGTESGSFYTSGTVLTPVSTGIPAGGTLVNQTADFAFSMSDGNWVGSFNLPSSGTNGMRAHIQTNATWTSSLGASNTDLPSALTLPTNTTADFVYSSAAGKWIYQGSVGFLGAEYSVDGGAFTSGYVAPTSQGVHTVQVRQSDVAGNTSASTAITFTIDTAAPAMGTLTLTDTGSSPTDGISQSGTVTVGGLEAGATWVYSIDNGSTWLAGSGTSFTLAAGTYAAGSVQMRETDLAGNVQTGALIAKNASAITVDQAAPLLVGSNPSDNGYLTAVGNNLVLNFNEAVAKGTGLIELYKADGTLVQSFDAATSTALTWSGNNLSINPTADLLASTGYYIKVAATAVKDVAGNAYAGITDATTLNFTTADASGAIVVAANGVTAIQDLSTIGDFNGDGYDDFIVGAGMNGLASTGGAAYVVYGNANGTVPNLSGGTIAASAGFKIVSGLTGDYFGVAANSAGDVNGDGLADLVVTAKYADASARESAYVVFGKSNASTVFATGLNVGTGLTASMGYQIKLDESYWGHAVSNAGDVNGDGLSDLLVTSDSNTGREVYVIYGKTGNASITMTSYTQFTPDMGYNVLSSNVIGLGKSVYGAGDVNGDGLADFIVGAPSSTRGMAYVVYGNSTGTSAQLDTTNGIAASQGFRIWGAVNITTSSSYFGVSVSSAGDVNGDGLADVMVSSPYESTGAAVYVVYGNSSGTNLDLNLSTGVIDPTRGFKITSALSSDQFGRYGKDIASAGDINGDGLSDMIIGGIDQYGGSISSTYVVYGNASGTNVAIDASGNIAASNGFKLKGAVGYVSASAGDINGDGLNDLLVGSRGTTVGDSYNVVLGGTQWVTAALDGAGTFAGTSGDEALIGSAGNDTITGGGGVDRFFAGKGDDTIVLTASDIANLQNNSTGQTAKTTVSGGTGFDTIRLSGGAGLDLLKVSNAAAMGIDETSRIEGIERIDMATDTAVNTLKISNKDINDMAGFNQIHTGSASADGKTWTNVSGSALSNITSYHQMVVDGGSTDTVALTANGGAWSNVGTVSNGTTQYTVYQNTATQSQLLVQQGVTVNTQAPTLLWSTPADNDFVLTPNLGNNITLQFSEAVVKGNGTIQLWNKTTGQPVEAFDVNSSALVTGWGTSTLTINPTANLAAKTDYFIKVSDNAIQDNSGLAYTGMNSDLPLNFSTQSADGSFAVTSSFSSAASTSAYLRSVATAGDFNGDGYDDLLVGVAGSSQSGVYVIYGNAQGEGLNLDKDPVMSNGVIAADQGFKIHGSGYFGTSVSGIGDVNGDGFADILIGASSDSQGGSNAGAAFVVYGSADPAALNLSSGTIAAARGFKIVGGTGSSSVGDSVSGVGDFNGDGIGDFIIGASGVNVTSGGGAAYVVYGKTNGSTVTLGTNYSIAAADGFILTGNANDKAGRSVSGAGDINGDGLADVIVGAPSSLAASNGASYVIFGGATGGNMDALVAAGKGFKIAGSTANNGHQTGTSVKSAGDVNGDGYADLIVATDSNQMYSAAYVVYGSAAPTSLTVSNAALAATQGFRIFSGATATGPVLGQVSAAGDLNGDGFADVIVGANNGSSYVVYGSATGADLDLTAATIAASKGFKLTYSTANNATTAQDVSFAGDFDGDGLTDLVIAEQSSTSGNVNSYKIVFGGTQWLTTPVIGNGAVTGTTTSEAILGSAANDTLTGGGGVDRFFGGMGNDTIVLSGTDVTNLGNVAAGQAAKASVNGGGGFDTLRMSGGAALNLTTITNAGAMGLEENSRIESIERIDLTTDTVANTLTLTAKDVNDMAGFNNIHLGGTTATNSDGLVWTNVTGSALSATTQFHQLVVDGSASDVLNLGTEVGWTNVGSVNNGISNYAVWQNTAKNSQVLVQSGMTVITPVSFALASDTGISASDFITKNGAMNVNLSVPTDTWSYSTDSGTTWSTGFGTSFVLGAGSYAANAVQVRENTLAGQNVAKFANPLTVDMTAPTVTVTMSDVALALGEKSTVTFQFSENVANFDINDVSIQNSVGGVGTGGLSALTKVSDSKWTAVYTPTAETNTTSNHIVVALNGYTDVAGNNGGTGQSTFNVDTRFSSSLTAGFYGTTSSSSSSNGTVTTNAVIVDYWNPAWQGDTIITYKNGSQIDAFTVSGATNSKSLGNLAASPGDVFYSTITHNGITYNLFNMIKVNPGTAGLTRYDSPLVLDLNGDGVQTVDISQGTTFDLQATGTAQKTGWVDAHDGLLAIDLSNDGKINSGAELFGSSTLLANGQKAADGWAALAQHDSNGDGSIDAQDAAFDLFKVWQDANGNGVTDAGELRSLKDAGVTRINLGHDNTITHQNGNLLQGVSSFTTTDGKTHDVVDAWFQAVTEGVKTLQNGESVNLATLNISSSVTQNGATDSVDLSGSGANTLQISLQDVLTGTASGRLQVTGNADDTVQLDASAWTDSGQVVQENGHSYAVFNASHGVAAQLLIDQQLVCHVL